MKMQPGEGKKGNVEGGGEVNSIIFPYHAALKTSSCGDGGRGIERRGTQLGVPLKGTPLWLIIYTKQYTPDTS